MQLISILTSLALTATTIAAPSADLEETKQINSTVKAAQAGNWEYCATDFWTTTKRVVVISRPIAGTKRGVWIPRTLAAATSVRTLAGL
ncbi:uncharacterized protein BDW43DRAFT_316061 [Aspergillus alliaceus]|uniref:uncharacterized protein n=1 Tax=Petromyces alliaceus TaxID=209559 RepID=UPI0012A58B57|nr:uncharacterized protein BDW43DRAFT_316061 [Aspergillus alliaceus]KAB8228318.1 hypothetical protein BDW43DRAFT_316061 [Aspergillus alliaceus]